VSEADPTKLRLWLRTDPYIPGLGVHESAPAADGSFTLTNIAPGDYRVGVDSVPDGLYIQSIQLGSEDLLNDGLHFERQPESQIDRRSRSEIVQRAITA
jgi:hypothetical protein